MHAQVQQPAAGFLLECNDATVLGRLAPVCRASLTLAMRPARLHGLTGATPSGRASAELQPLNQSLPDVKTSNVALQEHLMRRDALAMAGDSKGVRPTPEQSPGSPPFQLAAPQQAVAKAYAREATGGEPVVPQTPLSAAVMQMPPPGSAAAQCVSQLPVLPRNLSLELTCVRAWYPQASRCGAHRAGCGARVRRVVTTS